MSSSNIFNYLHSLHLYLKCGNIFKKLKFFSTKSLMKDKCSNQNYKTHFAYEQPRVNLNIEYLCNPKNTEEIIFNIQNRKGIGDIYKVLDHFVLLEGLKSNSKSPDYLKAYHKFLEEAIKIPNQSHPDLLQHGEMPHLVKQAGLKKDFNFKPKTFKDIAKSLSIVQNENTVNFTGQRSYYFMGQLAELESALVDWSLKKLLSLGFHLISVPDILNRNIIESCGMDTQSDRNQVYTLCENYYDKDLCLSGTSEMAIAGYLMNKNIPEKDLPLRLAAVSRCYRAETSKVSEERGIYRVHHFTKVEMFGVTRPEESSVLLEEFRNIQEELFISLGLHIQVLDMPLHELGAQAYRKFDVEAWMPGKKNWGEVSSCSDCTDFQSRRLSIKSGEQYVHTVNGTACAVPRLIIALLETHQRSDGTVDIPQVLQPFMRGKNIIDFISNAAIPHLRRSRTKSLLEL
uniref:serine--tRNA ligase n=1 Tax=Clastoptera arizonana TaxID=38151 RepID=A0A1B6CCF4_9HEMI